MKLRISLQIFAKSSDVKFHENPFQGKSSCSKRTDRHDEASSGFPQFPESI